MALVVWYHPATNTAVRHLDWERVPSGYVVSDDPAHAALADAEESASLARLQAQFAADPHLVH